MYVAVVGKEERNKNFDDALAEGEDGHEVHADEIRDHSIEQGEAKRDISIQSSSEEFPSA